MQQQIEMRVDARESRGKNAARRMRAAGQVPAVVYGLGREPQAVALDTKTVTNILKEPSGRNRVFALECDGTREHAMAVDYQIDPVKHSLLHVDMQRVELDKPVRVSIPIKSVGTAFGVKNEGGFEEMVSREVHVECLPLDIPESIEITVDDLHVGESIRVKDIPASDKYTVDDNPQKLVLHIMASRASAESTTSEEEEAEGEQGQAAE